MGKGIVILLVIGVVLLTVIFIVYKDITNNIKGEIKSVKFSNLSSLLHLKTDIDLVFSISNNSIFNLQVNDLKIDIFDYKTNTFIASNRVLKTVDIPIGVSDHNIRIKDVSIVSSMLSYMSGNNPILVKIEFRVFGFAVAFEEIVKI